jgi:hypothetical protein
MGTCSGRSLRAGEARRGRTRIALGILAMALLCFSVPALADQVTPNDRVVYWSAKVCPSQADT